LFTYNLKPKADIEYKDLAGREYVAVSEYDCTDGPLFSDKKISYNSVNIETRSKPIYLAFYEKSLEDKVKRL